MQINTGYGHYKFVLLNVLVIIYFLWFQLLATVISSNKNYPHHAEERQEAEEREQFVTAAVKLINDTMSSAIQGMDPCEQDSIDTAVGYILDDTNYNISWAVLTKDHM